MKHLTCVLLLCAGLQAPAAWQPIVNDSVWLDTNGNEITAQGGSMLKIGNTYYWYGFDGQQPPAKKGDSIYKSVKCYSSTDLAHWKFENIVFDVAGKIPNRMDVLYSPPLKKYVMLSKHMDAKQGIGISTCATPTGKFEWQGWAELPDSLGGGDQSAFVDKDGKGYLVYTPWRRGSEPGKIERNKHLTVVELTSDFLKVARVICQFTNCNLEAPAIFKRNGKYYLMASQVNWWCSSATSWCMADQIAGPWTPWKKLDASGHGQASRQVIFDTYNSQHDFVVEVKGSEDTFFMYAGDRYSNYTHWGVGRNVWLPLKFAGDVPCLDWYQTWMVDAEKGKWLPGGESRTP